jgi:hypothetical protein
MADDTLSPVGFTTSRVVKTHMQPQERFALACLQGELTAGKPNRSSLVREVMLAGLKDLGWPEARRVREYAKYRLECIERGIENPYESE